jgi:hypothetical protein
MMEPQNPILLVAEFDRQMGLSAEEGLARLREFNADDWDCRVYSEARDAAGMAALLSACGFRKGGVS